MGYIIAFIGKYLCPEVYEHREIIEKVIIELIKEYQNVTLLVTRESDFDRLVSSIINKIKPTMSSYNITHFVQLSCSECDYLKHEDDYMRYYDDKLFADYNCKLEYGDIFVVYKPDIMPPKDKLVIDIEKLIQ